MNPPTQHDEPLLVGDRPWEPLGLGIERQSQQGATVVRDAAAPPEERYRLWTKFQPTDDELARGARPGLYAMHSPDRLRWTPYPNQPTPPDQQCDTQNMLFWDHRIDQWVGYTRVRETQRVPSAAGGVVRFRRYRTVILHGED